jgi:hypothetical protein
LTALLHRGRCAETTTRPPAGAGRAGPGRSDVPVHEGCGAPDPPLGGGGGSVFTDRAAGDRSGSRVRAPAKLGGGGSRHQKLSHGQGSEATQCPLTAARAPGPPVGAVPATLAVYWWLRHAAVTVKSFDLAAERRPPGTRSPARVEGQFPTPMPAKQRVATPNAYGRLRRGVVRCSCPRGQGHCAPASPSKREGE